MKRLADLLLPRLKALAESRDPDFRIGTAADPYLRRWWVVPRNKWFNVYLHNMLHDDDDVLHDHPWASLSLVLTDGLEEHYVVAPSLQFRVTRLQGSDQTFKRVDHRTLVAGQWVYRSSEFAHQLVVKQHAWTLFMTGPVMRTWGFWCPKGWIPFKRYVKIVDNVSGVGRGCGEP